MKQMKLILLASCLAITLTACGGSSSSSEEAAEESAEEEKVYSEFSWPTSEIASLIPIPKSNIGEIYWEASYGFVIYVAETSPEDYAEYVASVQDCGFTVDYRKGDDYFWADNEDGYSVTVDYEGDNVMFIRMDEPDEEQDEEIIAQSAEEVAEEVISEESESEEVSTGIDPDFKEALDSYESFMDEYVEFMKKYQTSDDTLSMLTDYSEYLTKYADFAAKIDGLDQDEMNDEELAYYVEVTTRVSAKLLEVAVN